MDSLHQVSRIKTTAYTEIANILVLHRQIINDIAHFSVPGKILEVHEFRGEKFI